MSNSFYDLDLAFPGDEPDPAKLPVALVEGAIAQMPEELASVARAILVEKQAMAQVAKDLGINEGEVVTRLQQAQLAIGMHLFQQHGGRH